VTLIEKKLGRKPVRSNTRKHYLSGCEIKDMKSFLLEAGGYNNGFSPSTLEYLARNYGTEYKDILKLALQDRTLAERLNDDGEIMAQVAYAIRFEMARTLPDIIMRRTGIGTLGNPGEAVLRKVALRAADMLGWRSERMEKEIGQTNDLLNIPVQ